VNESLLVVSNLFTSRWQFTKQRSSITCHQCHSCHVFLLCELGFSIEAF